MIKVFFYGLLLSLLWSLPLITPYWLSDFSAADLVFGRFFVFGLVALVILPFRMEVIAKLRWEILQHHLLVVCIGQILFYLLLAASIQLIGPFPACVMLGVLPVLCCLIDKVECRKGSLYSVMAVLAFLPLIAVVCNCSEKGGTSGLAYLLLAAGCYLCQAYWLRKHLGTKCNLDASDHLLVSGLVTIPCLLVLIPLSHLDEALFQLFYAYHEPGQWRVFWLCAVANGFFASLVVKVLWRYSANHPVVDRFGFSVPLFSVALVCIETTHLPAGVEWAALISLAAALYLYYQLKVTNRSFQA